MKFSVFSVAVPEWTREEAVTKLAEIGYDGIAWRITDQETSDVPDFWIGNRSTWPLTGLEESLPYMNQLAADSGLAVSAFYSYPRWSDHDNIERHFAAAAAAGVHACRIVGPGRKTKSGPRSQLGMAPFPQLLEDTRRDLAWVADCAAEHGVRAITPLHHEWINASASGAMRMLEGLDPAAIGIIADVGHLAVEGWEDTLAMVQILGDYLDSLMLKNFEWFAASERADGTTVWEYRPASLRRGRVDITNLFAALHACGFDGWVTLAENTKTLPLYERMVDALAYMKAADEATVNARADEWVYDYKPGGGLWSGLEAGRRLDV